MIKIEAYRAADGKIFEDMDSCLRYEMETLKDFRMEDINGNITTSYLDAEKIVVDRPRGRDTLKTAFEDNYVLPWDQNPKWPDWGVWKWNITKWERIEDH